MCGIAGIFNYGDQTRPIDRMLLRQMTRLLAHRGPDGEDFYIDGPLGLGHRRLAIVDLTETGRQPMQTPDGKFCISYNGEIYNHLRLRALLQARGVQFRSTSDTETLLYLLAQGGPRALSETAGIFGFALWEKDARRLLLGRDHLGVKQLYYHDDGQRILFASEMKALLACPDIRRDMDKEAANEYLHFHTPLFERTFFRAIRQVKAAECIEVTAAGLRHRTYWHVQGRDMREGAPSTHVAELSELLSEVVADQLRSDVPVGGFFSGGIDSSAVAAYAKRAGNNLQLFGVHFSHPEVTDERPFQESAARALNLPLHLITVDGPSFADDFLKLSYFQDQPVIGPAMLPMYHVSRLAARQVKVCLGGQAADEIFAGYGRYALAQPLHVLGAILRQAWQGQRGPTPLTHPWSGNLLKQAGTPRNVRRLAQSALRLTPQSRYFHNFMIVGEPTWHALAGDPSWISEARAEDLFDRTVWQAPEKNLGDRLLHWDMQTYLTGLFQQDDRMTMAHGLESRVPFADPRLVQFAFRTPFDVKVRDGYSKWVLRQAVAPVLPPEILSRRKVGFDTPVPAWLRDEQAGFVRDILLSKAARERGWWKPDAVAGLLAAPARHDWFHLVWKLLSMEAWANVFVDQPLDLPDLRDKPLHEPTRPSAEAR